MTKVGVIIGRFQTPYPHLGHQLLLQKVADVSDRVHVFVGVAPFKFTKRNPLPYESVRTALRQCVKEMKLYPVNISPLPDCRTDDEWSQRLDTVLDTIWHGHAVTLYTGRDGFNTRYTGKYPVEVLDLGVNESSTQVRADIQPSHAVEEFREGVVYALTQQYEKASVCVDAIVEQVTGKKVLLVRKHGESLWRFPGGFVDPEDTSLEHSIRRELAEECELKWHTDPEYAFSTKVSDWRSSITTVVFTCNGEATGKFLTKDSEIAAQGWFYKDEVADDLVPEHQDIWRKYHLG